MAREKTTLIRCYKSDAQRILRIISLLQIEMNKRITTAEFLRMLLDKFEKDVEAVEKRLRRDVG